jgi:small subunit ribosomal protein S18
MARTVERASRRSRTDAGPRTTSNPCALCRDTVRWVDYKDVDMLRRYMSDRGRIRARRVTGNCTRHQNEVAQAVKTARELALLPYTRRTVTERTGARGRRRGEAGGSAPVADRGARPGTATAGPPSGDAPAPASQALRPIDLSALEPATADGGA